MLKSMFLVVDSEQAHSKAASLFGPLAFHSKAQLDKESQDQGG